MTVQTILTALIIPVVISVLGTWITYVFNVRRDRASLQDKHTWEQRTSLRKLVSKYHGPVLEAAVDWDRRMRQLYDGSYSWMRLKGKAPEEKAREGDQYFYNSVIFRFLTLMSLARQFEGEAFYIDARIADDGELEFLRYLKSLVWAMTHSDITPDDGFPAKDHFLNDEFRSVLDLCRPDGIGHPIAGVEQLGESRRPFTYRDYRRLLNGSSAEELELGDVEDREDARLLRTVLRFFADVAPDEAPIEDEQGTRPRRRWQRLVCLHLLVLGFIATFGYSWQKKAACDSLVSVVAQLRQDGVSAAAFVDGGRDVLGLAGQSSFDAICRAIEENLEQSITAARRDAAASLGKPQAMPAPRGDEEKLSRQ